VEALLKRPILSLLRALQEIGVSRIGIKFGFTRAGRFYTRRDKNINKILRITVPLG
jgi:hypothetical protein